MTETTTALSLATDTVVSVRDLQVQFPTPLGVVRALNGVSLDVHSSRVLGIVGESGSGKSVTARAILRIIEKPGHITDGQILFQPTEAVLRELREEGGTDDEVLATNGGGGGVVDLTTIDPYGAAIRAIRGQEISMIFQEPMSSLNPVYTVGDQIEEAVLLHQTKDRTEARSRAIAMLRRVGMPNPERIVTSYPHQLSGGMRQRAMIAMALSCHPTLLIADEPTTALDVTTEAQILQLMRDLQDETHMSIMLITHSMGVVAQLCDEVVVMYLGRIVERAPVDNIFYDPKHPYTVLLLRSIPRIGVSRHQPLEVIKGSVPDPYSRIPGCPFHPRCPSAMKGLCDTVDPLETPIEDDPTHSVRCHLYPGSTPEGVAYSLHDTTTMDATNRAEGASHDTAE